jgi:outer membrane lipoprotein-sorting protein
MNPRAVRAARDKCRGTTMRSKRTLLTTVVLATVLASQAVLGAQSVTTQNGVTIIRGNTDSADTKGGRVTREGGVTVLRGSAESFAPQEFAPDDTPRRSVSGGENLWIYDRETDKVTACHLKTTVYGDRAVRCTSN